VFFQLFSSFSLRSACRPPCGIFITLLRRRFFFQLSPLIPLAHLGPPIAFLPVVLLVTRALFLSHALPKGLARSSRSLFFVASRVLDRAPGGPARSRSACLRLLQTLISVTPSLFLREFFFLPLPRAVFFGPSFGLLFEVPFRRRFDQVLPSCV